MPSAAAIAANKWLPDAELRVYSAEYGRTGFPGRPRRLPHRRERPLHLGAAAVCRPHHRRAVDVHRRQERLGRLSEPRRARAHAEGGLHEDASASIWSTAPDTGCSRSSRKRSAGCSSNFSTGAAVAEAKTKRTDQSVSDFIKGLADESRRKDCAALVRLMAKAAGAKGAMYGPSIVGFGTRPSPTPTGARETGRRWRSRRARRT